MTRPLMSVMTDPVPIGVRRIIEPAKAVARKIKRRLQPLPAYMVSPYRGHPSVTRSLVEGLQRLGANANYNPRSLEDVADTLVVLSGIEALRQAIAFKKSGHVKTLFAGPNILVFPSDHADLIAAPEVDRCVTPCGLTSRMYVEDCPALEGRMQAWPAGVNTDYWKPDPAVRRDTVLIYEKQRKGPVGPVAPYKDLLE